MDRDYGREIDLIRDELTQLKGLLMNLMECVCYRRLEYE